MKKNRLIGNKPVIGIHPIIDARRGILDVRGSLEEQTMNMAKAAACAEQFKKEGVNITLSVTPCWCYGSETMDMDPMTIKGIWG